MKRAGIVILLAWIALRIPKRSVRRPLAASEEPPFELGVYPAEDRGSSIDVVQVLDAQTLRARTNDIFASAYLTLVSIVQGLALALLVQGVTSVDFDHGDGIIWAFYGEATASGLALVLVYYMYVWFVLVARWPPSALDTLIPFLLGGCQAGVILSVGSGVQWLIWLVILQVGAALAFGHTIIRVVQGMFSKREDYRLIVRLLWTLIAVMLAGASVAACVAILIWGGRAPASFAGVASVFLVALAVGCFVRCDIVLSRMYRANGLHWWRARSVK